MLSCRNNCIPKLAGIEICSKPFGCSSSSSVKFVFFLRMRQNKIPAMCVKLQDFAVRGENIVA